MSGQAVRQDADTQVAVYNGLEVAALACYEVSDPRTVRLFRPSLDNTKADTN